MVVEHMVNTPSGVGGNNTDHSDVLEVFKTLAEGNESERSSATSFLLSHLQSQQKGETESCSDLTYSLQRLVKGLSSNRKWARLGFSVALTQVLRAFDVVTAENVIVLIEKHLVVTQHDSKNEVGAISMGKAFGYLALIQSGKLFKDEPSFVSKVAKQLLEIAKQKSYLQSVCYHGMVALITTVSSEVFSDHLWQHLKAELSQGWADSCADTLLLVHAAAKSQKEKVGKNFLSKHWGGNRLFAESNYPNLWKVLIKTSQNLPVIHGIVDIVLETIVSDGSNIQTFIEQIIVKLISGTTSQKYLALHMYLKLIPSISTAAQMKSRLGHAVMEQLLYHLPKHDSILYTVCTNIVNAVMAKAGCGDTAMDLAVLDCFTKIGRLNFDLITKTHTVSTLLHKISGEAVKKYGNSLMAFVDGTSSIYPTDFKVQAVCQFCSLLTSPNLTDRVWRLSLLQFLLARSFFTVTCPDTSLPQCHTVTTDPEPSLHHCLNANLYKALNTLATFHPVKQNKADQFRSYVDLVYDLFKYANTLLSSSSVKINAQCGLQGEVVEKWREIVKVSAQIEKKRKKETSVSQHDAFLMLFMHVGLSLFSQPQQAMSVVDDISVCYEKACSKRKCCKKDDDLPWIEVVTEVLVSLMSQRSKLTRVIVNTVFSALQDQLTQEALAIVIQAVMPNKASCDQEAMLGFEDEEDMEADPEETEEAEKEEEAPEDKEESDSDEDSDDDDEDDNDDNDKENGVDDAMRETVRAALGNAAVPEDEEEEDDNQSEPDLSDSEMMALDDKLADAFLSIRKVKKKDKEKEKEIVTFRLRVVDLVEVVVRGPVTATHTFDLLSALLQLMVAGHKKKEEMALGQRATGIFKRLCNKHKEIITDGNFDKDSAMIMLRRLIQYSRKVHDKNLLRAVSDACVVAIRLIIKQKPNTAAATRGTRSKSKVATTESMDSEYMEKVLSAVRKSLSQFLYKKDYRLDMVFFHTMIHKQPVMFWPLTDIILESLCDDKVKVHSKTQAFVLLTALFQGGKQMVEELGTKLWNSFTKQLAQILNKFLLGLSPDNIKPKYTEEMLRVLARLFGIDPESAMKIANETVAQKLESIRPRLGKDSRSELNKILRFRNRPLQKGKSQKKGKKSNKKVNGVSEETEQGGETNQMLVNGDGDDSDLKDGGHETNSSDVELGKSAQKRRSSDEEGTSSPKKRKQKKSKKKV